jgi:photosystem II stability/assembly factor-like uncharacterized protein
MKKSTTLILTLLLSVSCIENLFEVDSEPIRIDGLDLEFQRLAFCGSNIHFVTEQTGYLTCGKIISRTDDGGKTWIHSTIDTRGELADIFFVNERVGFVLGSGVSCKSQGSYCSPSNAIILHTIDSGKTWNQTTLPSTSLGSVWFNTEKSGFAVGHTEIFATMDGGASWQEVALDSPVEGLTDVQFLNDQKGFITAGNGKLLRTTDGGKTWSILGPFFQQGGTLSLVREDLIFFAPFRGDEQIYRSFDLGNTWEEFANKPTAENFALTFVSEDVAYAVGAGSASSSKDDAMLLGAIYYTSDGSVTWKGSTQVATPITTVHFPTPNIGYAGAHTTLIKIIKK